ncbi:Hypothetical protein DEACI_3077 [Acididesulfobacillus acetoxydans]|uniref:Probable transposase n=1 Tax=Acididesulfobacillus acetoxydans TaxID=1561005 RepID=A0A8S0VXX4_9FIRM|nr:hypothetical protein [Acididesulfobacillus acetoxydans]CAA7602403.1 Hypothetical protein DEACI_3077 [Acididesulfobacillus acetoxydans]CEJ08362.1 Probable transposase [Acididesulfobacillus acetoxydans]
MKHSPYPINTVRTELDHPKTVRSQLAQSAIRRVASTYQGEWTKIKQNAEHRELGYTKKYYHGLEKAPEFKSRTTEMVYGRDYSFGKNQTAAVNTLEGQVRVAYEGWTPHVERLRSGEWKIGTAKLWYDKRRKALYLIVPITREQSVDLNDMTQVQGVDVGMRSISHRCTEGTLPARMPIIQAKHAPVASIRARTTGRERDCSSPAKLAVIRCMLTW